MLIFTIFFLDLCYCSRRESDSNHVNVRGLSFRLPALRRRCHGRRGRAVADTVTACWAVSIYALRF